MGGIGVTAYFAPYVSIDYTAEDIAGLLLEPAGFFYVFFLIVV